MAGPFAYAGMHWPANAGGEHPDRETIYALPGVAQGALLMCADSARYWYQEARSRCPLVVWRGLPRAGHLPAQLGWDQTKVAKEVTNLWDEQPHGGGVEWFVPLNELQFDKESGEGFPGYARTASHLAGLRTALRTYFAGRGEQVRLLFPAWVPSDDGDHASEWVGEAMQWDGLVLHAYGRASEIEDRYWAYRTLVGPDHPILIGEWNGNHGDADESVMLHALADLANADAQFLGSTYYVWETGNAGEQDLSVWGNNDRLALFQNPARRDWAQQPNPAPPAAQDPPVDPAPVHEPPAPVPAPVEAVVSHPDPFEHWSAERIASASGCPLDAVYINWPKLVEQLDHCGINDQDVQAAMIGTVAVETASTFEPVREAFWMDEDWRRANLTRYFPFYGRGFVQTTWRSGYAAVGPAIAALWGAGADDPAFDLVANPDNLLQADMAAAAAALFFRDTHALPSTDYPEGYTLLEACRAHDWEWVRILVQGGTDGLDRLVATVAALGMPTTEDAQPPAEHVIDGLSLTYNPDTSPERQVQDWACSIRATTWVLRSLGVNVDAGDIQDDMVGVGAVSAALGLLDHRGYGVRDELARHLPPGTPIEVLEAATWDDVVARAGRGPIAMGSTGLYHWLDVAGIVDADTLSSPNPAPNYPVGAPIGDDLTHQEFDSWPTWSLVFVETIPAATAPAPPAAPDEPGEQPGNAVTPPVPAGPSLDTLVGVAYSETGTVIPALLDAEQQTDADAMRSQVAAVVDFLRKNRPAS